MDTPGDGHRLRSATAERGFLNERSRRSAQGPVLAGADDAGRLCLAIPCEAGVALAPFIPLQSALEIDQVLFAHEKTVVDQR